MRGILVELIVPLGWKCGQKLETHSSILLVVVLELSFVLHSSCQTRLKNTIYTNVLLHFSHFVLNVAKLDKQSCNIGHFRSGNYFTRALLSFSDANSFRTHFSHVGEKNIPFSSPMQATKKSVCLCSRDRTTGAGTTKSSATEIGRHYPIDRWTTQQRRLLLATLIRSGSLGPLLMRGQL